MKPLHLSLRFKIPLWGGLVILATALALSLSFMAQAYTDLRHDVAHRSENLGRSLARSLFPVMLHDDLWRAYETVNLAVQEVGESEAGVPLDILVLDRHTRIFVASRPDDYPVLANLASLGSDFQHFAKLLAKSADPAVVWESSPNERLFVAVPIASDGVRLGTLIVVHSTSAFWPRFARLIDRAVWITLLVLGVLLPINWFWGRRMAEPLALLASRMRVVGRELPQKLPENVYPYHDELGEQFRAFNRAVDQLHEKAALEAEILRSERLAAVGRLAAGIAHEINNPLGGLINAVSTLKRHGHTDPVTDKTVSLIERGLHQIRDIVAAMLVEAKLKSRPISPDDIDDVRLLVSPQLRKKNIEAQWHSTLAAPIGLPATLVRQVMINLLLNAIQAAEARGHVALQVTTDPGALRIVVENSGETIAAEQIGHLFEPFSMNGKGRGMGLWITYQIVHQLKGEIDATSADSLTRFTVLLPLPESDDSDAPDDCHDA
jgi:signal transduction histidine kinase